MLSAPEDSNDPQGAVLSRAQELPISAGSTIQFPMIDGGITNLDVSPLALKTTSS